MTASARTLDGIDASRRAGWAKFFQLRDLLWYMDGVIDEVGYEESVSNRVGYVLAMALANIRSVAGTGFGDEHKSLPKSQLEHYYRLQTDGARDAREVLSGEEHASSVADVARTESYDLGFQDGYQDGWESGVQVGRTQGTSGDRPSEDNPVSLMDLLAIGEHLGHTPPTISEEG